MADGGTGGGYEVDDRRFPLVLVRYQGLVDDDAFEAYLQRLHEVRSRGPNVAILDATHAGYLPAIQRRRQAEWLREHAGMMRDNSLGTAFVIPSTLIRGVLTAILWIVPMPGPHVVVETHEQGVEWARARLRAAGLEARDAG